MRPFAFLVDVVPPAFTTVVLLSASLAYIYVEDVWVFSPSAWIDRALSVSGMGGS